MRRIAAVVVALALLGGAVACGDDDNDSAKGSSKTTLRVWVQWEGREFQALRKIVTRYEAAHPGVKVQLTPGAADTAKLLAAVRAGTAPDVWATYDQTSIGKFCSTGALVDLGPRMKAAKVDLSIFAAPLRQATTFEGTTCALPYLGDAFGLYYNKKLLHEAGYDAPPKTLSQFTEMAVKITKRDGDGNITVAGHVPLVNYYENYVLRFPPVVGARYFDDAGKAALGNDAGWKTYFTWQKGLVDALGYDALKKFSAGAGDEGSASNPFQTGKIAMVLDGEWRTAFIKNEAPTLDYGTAPFPAPDDHPELYGASLIAPGIIGIPRGSKHQAQAFELMRFLATDTDSVVEFASALHNIPSLTAAQTSPKLDLGPNMEPFLAAFSNPRSGYAAVIRQGAGYFDPITQFAEKWEAGKVSDLDAGLHGVDREIDALNAQG